MAAETKRFSWKQTKQTIVQIECNVNVCLCIHFPLKRRQGLVFLRLGISVFARDQ